MTPQEHSALVKKLVSVKEVQPGRCDPKIWEEGEFFCLLAGPRSWMIEAWVKELRRRSKVKKVDWSFMGGRAVVRYLGGEKEFEALVKAAEETRPALEEAAKEKSTFDLVKTGEFPSVQWLNSNNPWGEAGASHA